MGDTNHLLTGMILQVVGGFSPTHVKNLRPEKLGSWTTLQWFRVNEPAACSGVLITMNHKVPTGEPA